MLVRFLFILIFTSLLEFLYGQAVQLTPAEQAFVDTASVIVLGGDASWEPMIIQNTDGSISGFEQDYLDELSRLTGLKFEIKAGIWKDIVEEANKGQIDGLLYSSPEPQRLKYFKFSQPYNKFRVGFYSHASHQTLSDTIELKDKVVGIQKSDQFLNNYLDGIPYITKKQYNTRREMVEAILSGEIEYFFSALDFNYYLWKNSIPGIRLIYIPDDEGFDVVYSINKSKSIILGILNKGIAAINPSQRNLLMNKWLRVDQSSSQLLSERQYKYLLENPKVTIVARANGMPIVSIENERIGGLLGDYLDLMSSKLPVNFIGVEDTGQVSIPGSTDVVYLSEGLNAKQAYLHETDPFLTIPHGMVMQRGRPFYGDIGSMGDLRIGVLTHEFYQESIAVQYPNIQTVSIDGIEEALSEVLVGNIDGYIGSIAELNYYIQSQGYSDLFIAALTDYNSDIRFASSNPMLIEVFQQAINEIKDVEKQELIKKWYGSGLVSIIDKRLAYQIAIISGVLLAVLVGWIFSLRRQIKKRKRFQVLLQQNQADILALVENTDALIYSLDINLYLRAKNSAVEQFMLHYTDEPIRIGSLWLDYYPANEKDKWMQRFLRALEGEKYSVQDTMIVDGQVRTFVTSFNPIMIDGMASGVSCIGEDVTELVKVNQYMLSLMDTAYDHIFIKDLDRRYVIASQSLADLNGFTSWKEMIGKRDLEINEFNARQVADDELRVLEDGLHAINKEHQFMDRDGEVRWVQATTEPIYGQDGQIIGLSGVSRDVTRRREAERQQKILISSIENSSDFISFLDDRFRFIYINKFGVERLGFQDYENVHIQEVLDEVTFKIVANGFQKYALQGKIWEVEFDVIHRQTGEQIPLDHQIFPIYDDHEGFICYANVARDLTERNKLQAQVLRAKVNEQLMNATLKAEDQERFRIAHELHDGVQQKIATVNMYLQTLEENSEENKVILANGIERLNEAIAEIRNMSHSLIPRALRNSGLTATLQDEVEQLNSNTSLEATFHENVGNKRFHQDIELNLYRIFQEATTNIFKHAHASSILVQLMEIDERLSLVIEDDGDGFEMKDVGERDFGLSSIKNRAAGIDAHIEIDSVPGQGTSILIELEPETYVGE